MEFEYLNVEFRFESNRAEYHELAHSINCNNNIVQLSLQSSPLILGVSCMAIMLNFTLL